MRERRNISLIAEPINISRDKKPDKISRLDTPKRLTEYRFDDIFTVMELSGGERVAEIGSGTGLFSMEIA